MEAALLTELPSTLDNMCAFLPKILLTIFDASGCRPRWRENTTTDWLMKGSGHCATWPSAVLASADVTGELPEGE